MATASARAGPSPEFLWREAQRHLVQGRLAAARDVLETMRANIPRDSYAHLLAAQIAWREDHVRDASAHALAAVNALPDDPGTLCALVAVLLEMGGVVAARSCLEHPALAQTTDPRLLMRMSQHRKRLEEHAEALALLDRARASGHDTPALRFRRGEQLLFNGRFEEAEAELVSSFARAPAYGRVAIPLVRLRKQTEERNHLAMIERGLRVAEQGGSDHAALEFARYKTLEDLGRYDEAWEALARGNALMHARMGDEADRHHAYLDQFLAACSSEVLRPSGDANAVGSQPIFIVGLARSGTTVLERMLGNHSRVVVAGELSDLGAQLHWVADTRNTLVDTFLTRFAGLDFAELGRRYLAQTQWRARGASFFTDKQPPNWVLAGVIRAALPRAKILHLVRDPMDVCFSNWRAWFGDFCAYSYDLTSLAAHYRCYRRTMAHWHASMPGAMLDVRYADLVREPEATLRKVFDFCGLDWQPGCGDIRNNPAPVATLSAAQMREPIRTDTSGQWQRYATQLEELAATLTGPFVGEVGG